MLKSSFVNTMNTATQPTDAKTSKLNNLCWLAFTDEDLSKKTYSIVLCQGRTWTKDSCTFSSVLSAELYMCTYMFMHSVQCPCGCSLFNVLRFNLATCGQVDK